MTTPVATYSNAPAEKALDHVRLEIGDTDCENAILSDNEEGNLACVVNTGLGAESANLVSCVGQSPGDNSGMFNLILKG